jgi:hypothetical protein
MNEQVPAYILTRSGRIRDGLVALLRAIPEISPIKQVTCDLTDLKSIPDQNKALVLLDANLVNQEVWNYMKQVKGKNFRTQCKCIVLAETVFQQRLAKAAGADEVLLVGFPAVQFFAAIEKLLNPTTTLTAETRKENGSTGTK